MDLQIVINKKHEKKRKISWWKELPTVFQVYLNPQISYRGKWCFCNAQHSSNCVCGERLV